VGEGLDRYAMCTTHCKRAMINNIVIIICSCPQPTGSNVPRDHVCRGGVRDDGSGCPRPSSSLVERARAS